MTILSDYCARVRDWIDDQDPSDSVITEWIRDAEERMNNELRTTEQVVRTIATFDDDCTLLPDDWLETIYVKPKGRLPLNFVTNREYWHMDSNGRSSDLVAVEDPAEVYPSNRGNGVYTHVGNTLYVWPHVDPTLFPQIEICYFRGLVPLGETADVIFTRYPSVYRTCTLAAGTPYLVEDERLQTWAALATAGIQKANQAAAKARFSGSPIAPRIRGFG